VCGLWAGGVREQSDSRQGSCGGGARAAAANARGAVATAGVRPATGVYVYVCV